MSDTVRRMGTPCSLRKLLQVGNGVLGIVKDRRRQRGVGCRRVKTSTKWSNVPAPPEAMTGMDTALDTAAVSSQSKPDARAVAIDGRQQDLAGAARLGFAAPTRRRRDSPALCRCARRRRSDRRSRFASMATTTAWLP